MCFRNTRQISWQVSFIWEEGKRPRIKGQTWGSLGDVSTPGVIYGLQYTTFPSHKSTIFHRHGWSIDCIHSSQLETKSLNILGKIVQSLQLTKAMGNITGGWQFSGWTSGDIYSILLGRLGGLGENICSFSFHSNTQVTCFSLRKWQNCCLIRWHLLDNTISNYTKQMMWNKWSMCFMLSILWNNEM